MAAIRLGDEAPNFTAETTAGPLDLHEYLGDGWGVLFSHPADVTPVCATERGAVAGLAPEVARRNTKVLAVGVDPLAAHERWLGDIADVTGARPAYPLVADPDRAVARRDGMTPPDAAAAATTTVRSVFVIGPDKRVKLTLTDPAATGRDSGEILRAPDSLPLTAAYQVATPADWRART